MTKLGEFLVSAVFKSLKAGAILDSVATNYISNYCTKGWITDDEMQTALTRIVSIAAGEGDPAEEVAEEAEEITDDTTEETETDYSSMTVTALKELAKERGLSGYSSLDKAGLIAMLEADDAEKAAEAEAEEVAEEKTAEPEETEAVEAETEESTEPEAAEESTAIETEEEPEAEIEE